jgi:hypothetical protein
MSTDETPRPSRRFRWPLSLANTVVVAVCIAGAIFAFVAGSWRFGIPLLLGGVLAGLFAVLARRRSAGDLERVNAMEYADERDRAAGVKGLAAVGVSAVVLSGVQLILAVVLHLPSAVTLTAAVFLLILCVVWIIANWYYVRRG